MSDESSRDRGLGGRGAPARQPKAAASDCWVLTDRGRALLRLAQGDSLEDVAREVGIGLEELLFVQDMVREDDE